MASVIHRKIFAAVTAASVGFIILTEEILWILFHSEGDAAPRFGYLSSNDLFVALFFSFSAVAFGATGLALSFTRLSGKRAAVIAAGTCAAYLAYIHGSIYLFGHGFH